jgi:hypothetical protein
MTLESTTGYEDEGRTQRTVFFVDAAKFQMACDMFWIPNGFESYYSPRIPLVRDKLHAWSLANWLGAEMNAAPSSRRPAHQKSSLSGGGWTKVV